jgi:hypothetical protein
MTLLIWYMVYSQILLNFLLDDCHFGYIKRFFFKKSLLQSLSTRWFTNWTTAYSETYSKGVDLTIKVSLPTQSLEPQLPVWI